MQGQQTVTAAPAVRQSDRPLLVPVLSVRQELVLRLLAVAWLASSLRFWLWWFAPGRGAWQIERVVATIGLGWLTLLGAYFLFFGCRMLRPNPSLPIPQLRVAIVVTKAPSEPWAVLERTLTAMLDQDFPYPYDTWLADEQPTDDVLRWCVEHGVRVSSRYGVEDYHQLQWPRRTRCKEGNLAYFYDMFGYDAYDVVAQLDSDHVPTPTYLREVVAPFRDPAVGYVAAPSICDSNADAGWTVRGRLYREATLHGPGQAGANAGWAPLCIGSHYAVRTQALREIGGLGPELAEDYTTTLAMLSAGWDGVFAIDAEAHGAGPETLNDMLVQEVQWARSLGAILVTVFPGQIRTVSRRARLRMTFALMFYPVQAAMIVLGTCLPAIGVITDTSWGEASFADFYLRLWICSVLILLSAWWLRRCATMRPVDAKMWSLDIMLFQLVRWPWTAAGFLQGMAAGHRNVEARIQITPKTPGGDARLNWRMLAPTIGLTLAPAIVLALTRPGESTLGLYVLLAVQALLYAGVLIAVIVLNLRTARRRGRHLLDDLETADPFLERIMVLESQPEMDPSSDGEIRTAFFDESANYAFPVVRKGWDPVEVRQALDDLRAERDALLASSAATQQLAMGSQPGEANASENADEFASVDVFGQIGEQVAGILRAAEDSARITAESAVREAESRQQQAERQSLALLDAAAGRIASAQAQADALLDQARAEADEMRQAAVSEAAKWQSAAREVYSHLEAARASIGQSVDNFPTIVRGSELLGELPAPVSEPVS